MNRFPLLVPLALIALTACSNDAGDGASAPPTAAEPMAQSSDAVTMPRSPAPEGARAFFITPADGASVTSPFTVEFGIEGMEIVAAGVDQKNSGHHHLLIDTGLPPLGAPVPSDKNHRHFGDGSTSVELELEPGEHTLQLLLGDHLHVPHEPPVTSEVITVTVE
jgi:hypothetical protein